MNSPYLLFLVSASPLIALIIDALKGKHSQLFNIIFCSTSLLLASPILFSDYDYVGEFSNFIVISFSSILLNLCWMQYVKRGVKTIVAFGLSFISLIPIGLMFFGRSFVGGPTIYNIARVSGYKVVHLRSGSPGILEQPHFELHKTIALGLLEKAIDYQYLDENNRCQVVLKDSNNKKLFIYDHCEDNVQIK
jgi:hypothetical protein